MGRNVQRAERLRQAFQDEVRKVYLADLERRIAAGVTPGWVRLVGEATVADERLMDLLVYAMLPSAAKPTSDRMSVGE